MSSKEPAIKLLKERYGESFAITQGVRDGQVHLFIIRAGMWALVWTFSPKDMSGNPEDRKSFGINQALDIIEASLLGKNLEMVKKLDQGVKRAFERMRVKANELKPKE